MPVRVIIHDDFTPAAQAVEERTQMRHAAMDATLGIIHGAVVPITPVGVTSVLRGSWHTEVREGLDGSVEGYVGIPEASPAGPYGDVIETGRRRGRAAPPVKAIERWVRVKLGDDVDPYVVARSIGKKGIRGRKMLKRAETLTWPIVKRIWDRVGGRLTRGG